MKLRLSTFLAALMMTFAVQAAEPDNTMIIKLKAGDVTIALRADLAPQAC